MLIKIGRQLFAFLSSLQLAVVTIVSLAIVLAVGTFYESRYDAETAKHYVYGTTWFLALLFFLGLNVFFAALSRWPWKRHHIGFLITHLGILTLLTGSLVTLLKGYEGQVILAEGETGRRMTLAEPQLFIYDPFHDRLETVPAPFRFDPPSKDRPYFQKVLGNILIKVDQYLPHAASEIKVEAGAENNPAVKIRLAGSRATLEEWLFSRERDRQRLELGPASLQFVEVTDLKAFRDWLKEREAAASPNEMIIAQTESGELHYWLRRHGTGSEVARLPLKGDVETGWMDFKLFVLEYLPRAKLEKIYRKVPTPPNKDKEGPPPAIHVNVANIHGREDFWIGRGEERDINLGDRPLKFAYGLKSLPLGFELTLVDFQMGLNEGTQDPASFQSQVTLVDPAAVKQEDHLISMNEPLKYGSYKLFQASYQLNPGGSDWSVLAVSYDPGIPIKYTGALVMVLGILTMFFLKPLFIQNRIAEKRARGSFPATPRPDPLPQGERAI